jgi:hypothetical protein
MSDETQIQVVAEADLEVRLCGKINMTLSRFNRLKAALASGDEIERKEAVRHVRRLLDIRDHFQYGSAKDAQIELAAQDKQEAQG